MWHRSLLAAVTLLICTLPVLGQDGGGPGEGGTGAKGTASGDAPVR